MGVCEPAISRDTRKIVPSPPNTSRRSTLRAIAAASGHVTGFSPVHSAVVTSANTLRPARATIRAASLTMEAQAAFSELPISPTRLILSASSFKQSQKFLIARRPQHRRFREPAPRDARQRFDKFLRFPQHPLVNRRIPYDTGPSIGLSLAGLELRFNECNDFTGRTRQCNGRGEN